MHHAHGFDKGSEVSRLKAWEQVKKSTGIEPEGLKNKPQLDDNLVYLWDLFIEIRRGCGVITYLELQAYQNITGVDLSVWECSVMLDIDKVWNTHG